VLTNKENKDPNRARQFGARPNGDRQRVKFEIQNHHRTVGEEIVQLGFRGTVAGTFTLHKFAIHDDNPMVICHV
jgi:hypothetical protein